MEPAQLIRSIGAFGDMSKLKLSERAGPRFLAALFLLRAAPVTISVAHYKNGRPKWFLDLTFIISVSACDFHMQN